jgi:hypothetical protein
MKKNLILLTGIVLLIAVLAAGGCSNSKKQNGSTSVVNPADPTKVDIFLKDTLIDGRVHLEMYDSKKPKDVVVDSLYTEVNPGDTVIFYKAHKSDVKKVLNIRPVKKEDVNIFSEGDRQDSGLYVLIISPEAQDSIIVKYDIVFEVKKDTTTHIIDPYLRIPPQSGGS